MYFKEFLNYILIIVLYYIVVSCPRPYFTGIGSGNIELFQGNSIIVNVTT